MQVYIRDDDHEKAGTGGWMELSEFAKLLAVAQAEPAAADEAEEPKKKKSHKAKAEAEE